MANLPNNYLIVSEQFYSIQGEGPTTGTPAVFLRLSGCNLLCEGFSYRDPNTGEHLGCDTKLVWKQGQRCYFSAIFEHWQKNGWLEKLTQGAHLIVTGGEPTLQQTRLNYFLTELAALINSSIYIEMETNATRVIEENLFNQLTQINASPKLSSSGETKAKAYNLSALQQLAQSSKTRFKFVVSNENDIAEIIEHYQIPLSLKPQQIWLMPEGGTEIILKEKNAVVS